jgi:hypothetical protein
MQDTAFRGNQDEQMATYRVCIVNEHFAQSGEHEAPDVVHAWKGAIRSAIEIGADQVSHGNPFFGAEVTLEEGNKRIGRYVVSIGATPLKE